MNGKVFDVWLSLAIGQASGAYRRLAAYFSSAYEIYRAEAEELEAVGLTPVQQSRLLDKSIGRAEEEIARCEDLGGHVVTREDPEYPERLAQIKNPPYLLYVRGILPPVDRLVSVAVVGTRDMSEYGMKTAYRTAYELSGAGAVVVSGLALGVDASAACGALDAGGTTVAVIGSGLDVPYPRTHERLAEDIAASGAVVTEYPLGTRPYAGNFPQRNRIISGLALGTLVVEAGSHSGAILTARSAAEEGRTVFAVPGKVGDERAAGTNELIRTGAKLVLNAGDVLAEYAAVYGAARWTPLPAGAEEKIAPALEKRGVTPAPAQSKRPAPEPLGFPDARQERRSPASRKPTGPAPAAEPEARPEPAPTPEPAAKKSRPSAPKPDVPGADLPLEGLPALPEGDMKRIYEAMTPWVPEPPDKFSRLGLDPGKILGLLSSLEIMGYIVKRPGGCYLRGE